MNEKSIQASSLLGHFLKSDVRYWQRAVFRQTYTHIGKARLTKDWTMKIAHEGRRETFPLGTPIRQRPQSGRVTSLPRGEWLGTDLDHVQEAAENGRSCTDRRATTLHGRQISRRDFPATTNYWSEALRRAGTRTRVGTFLTPHGPDV
jgi:hypothetical protein